MKIIQEQKTIKRKGHGIKSLVNTLWLTAVSVNALSCCNFYRIKQIVK